MRCCAQARSIMHLSPALYYAGGHSSARALDVVLAEWSAAWGSRARLDADGRDKAQLFFVDWRYVQLVIAGVMGAEGSYSVSAQGVAPNALRFRITELLEDSRFLEAKRGAIALLATSTRVRDVHIVLSPRGVDVLARCSRQRLC